MSSTPEFARPRHRLVWKALEALDAQFLADTRCYFGGGTRVVLSLGEYRQSADIDLLCADAAGYRQLRNTITQSSLGSIIKSPIALAREVRADRHGIRTFMELEGEPVKLEIISEGRIRLDCDQEAELPVPSLDPVSCFAEKFLANADRWADRAVLSRDIIDIAFMIRGWGADAAVAGLRRASEAYGEVVVSSTGKAIGALEGDTGYFRHCLRELAISDGRVLRGGLRQLSQVLDVPTETEP